jgi:hypothetical protein
MSGDFLELRIPITENTTKKIVALAALTGKSLPDIKEAIAADLIDEEAFDAFVSQQLHGALAEMDGATEEDYSEQATYSVTMKIPKGKKGFAQAEQESMNIVDSIAGHSLSGDEDTGAPSLEEQYRKEEQALRARPVKEDNDFPIPEQDFPDVGNNVDAFIDIDGSDESPKQANLRVKATTPPNKSSSRKGRKGAMISEYTGDEDASLF